MLRIARCYVILAAPNNLNANSVIRHGLQADPDQLISAGSPVDVCFIQGKQVLGL